MNETNETNLTVADAAPAAPVQMRFSVKRLLLFLLIVGFIGLGIYSVFAERNYSSGVTEIALNDNFVRTVDTEAYIIRAEEVIPAGSGTKASIVSDGDHVAANETVAYYLKGSSAAADILRRKELQDDLKYYTALLGASAVHTANPYQYDDTIYSDVCEYAGNVSSGKLSTLPSMVSKLRSDISSRQTAAGEQLDVSAAVAAVEEELRELSGITDYEEVKSPSSGYYVSFIDGLEGKLKPDDIDTLTADELREAMSAEQKFDQDSYTGKVITSYRWYFACVIPISEAAGLNTGDKKNVTWDGISSSTVTASVEKITKIDGEENYLVIFSCLEMNSEVAALRHSNATIAINEYKGLKISSSAIRQVTDPDGTQKYYVTVVEGNSKPTRRINIIYSGDDYSIVTGSDGENQYSDGLKLYDIVLVRNSD